MQALRGITWLLLMQSLGEVISRSLHLPLPGPVVGMLLLLAALQFPLVSESVRPVADFLLQHLSLLFVPVGVGVMTHVAILSQYGVRIAIVIVLSTWISLAVSALVLRALMKGHADGDGTAALPSTAAAEDAHG
ncbi:CidA/LrgA family protein [Rhodoferax lacus]|uniref:CidA/LrgA family protein n=1 Tax=Rhodoferax lacus TaxID=2184758 RepID=A0A3E1R9W7_9BURK|nr:CidA/LrgA family protein [Rhodoferax lacus]RFO96053.1 CidA/LrgA family protein [Rhodoferax lacus]